MTPEEEDIVRRRLKSRAIVMGLLLGGLAILIFFITLSRIRLAMT
ncbi:MAG: hypothetical protein OSB00_09575 [Sphingomonas bacterium]|nr:hypothetical protein [Sphingomonas bacterium]